MLIIRVRGLRGMLRDEGLVGACIARCIGGLIGICFNWSIISMGKRGMHRHGGKLFQVICKMYMHVHLIHSSSTFFSLSSKSLFRSIYDVPETHLGRSQM